MVSPHLTHRELSAFEERTHAIRASVQEVLRQRAEGDQAHQLEDVRRVIHEQIAAAERRALTLGQPFADTEALARRLLADLLGLGPLQPLLDDPAVEEIIVNGPRRVFVIADGRKELTEVTLPDDSELLRLVRRAIGPLGGRLNLVDRPVTGAVCRRVEPCTLPPHSC